MPIDFKTRCADCASLVNKNGVWCCDECFGQCCKDIDDCPYGCTAQLIEDAEAKAKANKVAVGAKADKERKPSTRERKPDPDKENLIKALAEFLGEYGAESVKITNISKMVEFNIGDFHYKLDLVRQRPPKK